MNHPGAVGSDVTDGSGVSDGAGVRVGAAVGAHEPLRGATVSLKSEKPTPSFPQFSSPCSVKPTVSVLAVCAMSSSTSM